MKTRSVPYTIAWYSLVCLKFDIVNTQWIPKMWFRVCNWNNEVLDLLLKKCLLRRIYPLEHFIHTGLQYQPRFCCFISFYLFFYLLNFDLLYAVIWCLHVFISNIYDLLWRKWPYTVTELIASENILAYITNTKSNVFIIC